MHSEDAWRTANRIHEAAESMRRSADRIEESTQQLKVLLEEGYGGNAMQLVELLQKVQVKVS